MKHILKRLSGSEIFRSLGSSSVLMVAQVGGNLATLGYTLVFVRLMTPEEFGAVSSIWALALLLVPFATLNLASNAIRVVVKARQDHDDALAAGFVLFVRRTILVVAPVVMALFVLLVWIKYPELLSLAPVGVALTALAIPGLANVRIGAAVGVSLDKAVASQVPRTLVRPVMVLVVLLVFVAFDWPLELNTALALFAATVIVNLGVQHILLKDAMAFTKAQKPRIENPGQWISTGFFLLPGRIVDENSKNIMIVSAAAVLALDQVALIAIALSLTGLLNFAITAVGMAFSAKLSQALHANNKRRITKFLASSGAAKLVSIAGVIVAILFLLEPVLGFFGKHYTGAGDITVILLGIPIVKAVFGPSDLVLLVHGLRNRIFWLRLVTLALLPLSAAATLLLPDADPLRVTSIGFLFAFFVGYAGTWWVARRETGIDTSAPGAIINLMRDRAKKN